VGLTLLEARLRHAGRGDGRAGLRERVRDGETGLLVPRDAAALARALGRVLGDAALRGRLAAGAAAGRRASTGTRPQPSVGRPDAARGAGAARVERRRA